MKVKEYLEKKAAADKAAYEAGKPPTFKAASSPSFACKVMPDGALSIHGTCPAADTLALAECIKEIYSE